MGEKKELTELGMGQQFEAYEFQVTPDFNQQYLYAVEDYHPRYLEETNLGPPLVHPSLLLNQSNLTRSPSYRLPPGISAVHAKEEVEFLNPGRVGKTFKVTWKVIDAYEKRGKSYSVTAALVVDEDGLEILRRRTHGFLLKG